MQLPSKIMEEAVNEFAKLPGIGKKTALRLVIHMLKQNEIDVNKFTSSILHLKTGIQFCKRCFNIADQTFCSICSNKSRDQTIVCVVESIRDLIAIESTNQYHGAYHVLGGVISPIDGIGPDSLQIQSLLDKVKNEKVSEIIMALNPSIEGDTTIFYISKKIDNLTVKITSIARGISFGSELEYTDEITLARSMATRLPYEKQLKTND